MDTDKKIRLGWIKGMYIYTILGAGLSGAGMIILPGFTQRLMGMGRQDPLVFGIAASVWLAFGILSIFGLKAPLKFLPVLGLQFVYKSVWITAVVIPLLVSGNLPEYSGLMIFIMLTYIVGDLIAIPFSRLFGGTEPS